MLEREAGVEMSDRYGDRPSGLTYHGLRNTKARDRAAVEWTEFQTLERICEGFSARAGTPVKFADRRAELPGCS